MSDFRGIASTFEGWGSAIRYLDAAMGIWWTFEAALADHNAVLFAKRRVSERPLIVVGR